MMDRLEQVERILRDPKPEYTMTYVISLVLLDIAHSLRQMAAPIEDGAEPEEREA